MNQQFQTRLLAGFAGETDIEFTEEGKCVAGLGGGEIEWKRKNVDFWECYSPLPEDLAGKKRRRENGRLGLG